MAIAKKDVNVYWFTKKRQVVATVFFFGLIVSMQKPLAVISHVKGFLWCITRKLYVICYFKCVPDGVHDIGYMSRVSQQIYLRNFKLQLFI